MFLLSCIFCFSFFSCADTTNQFLESETDSKTEVNVGKDTGVVFSLNAYNIKQYFDVYITATATSNNSVSYAVRIVLKSKYAQKRVLVNSTIRITLKLDTEYEYYEVGTYTDLYKNYVDARYLYFNFYNETNLKTGVLNSTASSVYLSSLKEYYGMDISYSYTYFGCAGELKIYN